MQKPQIDTSTIKSIESVLSKGDRVEIIPVKDGIRVMRVKRETVKHDVHNSRLQMEKQ